MTRQALIYRPAKSAMQSGTQNRKRWWLEFRNEDAKSVDPTMGWISSEDTTRQIKLYFDTEAEAIAYSEQNQLQWEVVESDDRLFKPKSYANNFATGKRRYFDGAKHKINL